MTTKMVVGSNPTSHTLRQRLWDLVTWSLFLTLDPSKDFEVWKIDWSLVTNVGGLDNDYLL
jgi:hypothetical protein